MCDKKEMEDLGCLPQGSHLYRKRNEAGGWIYYSNENGCMSVVWDTSIVDESTLLSAILSEQHRRLMEVCYHNGWRPTRDMEADRLVGTGGSFLGPIHNQSMDSPTVEGSGVMSTQASSGSGVMPGHEGEYRDE